MDALPLPSARFDSSTGAQKLSLPVFDPPGCHARGSGFVQLSRSGAGTVLSRRFAVNPLKLLNPKNHGSGAWIYTSTYGGGIVDGDAIDLRIHVDAVATGFLSSQSSTKVYRCNAASQSLHATLEAGALLIVAPDPLVCFKDAHFAQRQHFNLHADANLVLVDCLAAGRVATGERWSFKHYESAISLSHAGSTVLHDVIRLNPAEGSLLNRLRRFNAVATVVLSGPKLAQFGAALHARVAAAPLSRRAELIIVASPLKNSGTLLRIASTSVERVQHEIQDCLAFVPDLLGDNPWSRKW